MYEWSIEIIERKIVILYSEGCKYHFWHIMNYSSILPLN